jgi:hypothetical protein
MSEGSSLACTTRQFGQQAHLIIQCFVVQQPAGPPPQPLQLPDSGAAPVAAATGTAMATTSTEIDAVVPPPPPPEVCGVPTSGGATSPAAPPPPKPMELGQSGPDAGPLAAAAGGQPDGGAATDGLMPAGVPPAPELGPSAELSQVCMASGHHLRIVRCVHMPAQPAQLPCHGGVRLAC